MPKRLRSWRRIRGSVSDSGLLSFWPASCYHRDLGPGAQVLIKGCVAGNVMLLSSTWKASRKATEQNCRLWPAGPAIGTPSESVQWLQMPINVGSSAGWAIRMTTRARPFPYRARAFGALMRSTPRLGGSTILSSGQTRAPCSVRGVMVSKSGTGTILPCAAAAELPFSTPQQGREK